MKAAIAIAEFLRDQGIKHVFCISGGASLHLIHGINDTEGIQYVCPQTEQAASFAADAYARLTGLGCALATSGPGGTNLITGIGASYYDSIPVLYIAGQVTTFRMAKHYGNGIVSPRQLGFQETPIVEIVKEITKYAVEPMRAEDVMPAMREAARIAKKGRPGPVLISIPDDLQRADIT